MTFNQANMNSTILGQHADSMAFDFRRAALWHWIERYMPRGVRTLDAGCGTGYMTRRLASLGNETVGLEHDATLADFARSTLANEAWQVPVHQMPLGDGSVRQLGEFGAMICLDVLEHIEDDRAALRDLAAVLRPEGVLLISVPAMPALYGKRDEHIGHFRRYSPAMLRALIADAGLRLDAPVRYWNALGVPPYWWYEKILQRPINDELRKPSDSSLKRFIGKALYAHLYIETYLLLPLGLSLLARCRKA